jgi:pimeloyl-ACP methyl ester carboxylesterase
MSYLKHVRTAVAEIGYEESGLETAFPIIFLHGFPDDIRSWDAVIDRLAHLPIRTLRPYLRGYGPTRVYLELARSGQIAALAQDLLDFIDALELGSFLAVGQDWGARAVQVAAMLAPEKMRGMVTIASAVHQSTPKIEQYFAQTQAYWYQLFFHTKEGEKTLEENRVSLGRYLWRTWSPSWNFPEQEYLAVTDSFHNPEFVQTVTHYYRHRWRVAPGAAYYEAQEQVAKAAPPVAVPHIFICGSADACIAAHTSENLGRFYIGGYERIVAQNAGHFVQHEQPDLVTEQIQKLLPT